MSLEADSIVKAKKAVRQKGKTRQENEIAKASLVLAKLDEIRRKKREKAEERKRKEELFRNALGLRLKKKKD